MAAAAADIDPVDRRLLDRVQQGIPLTRRPFRALGDELRLSEDDVLARLRRLRDQRRIIRQISAIFDTRALGYVSTLVAGRYAPERLDQAAAVVSTHPGVSHNYQRNSAYNLWYTLAVPPAPDSRLGLQGTLDLLHRLSGALATRALPTRKLYKIGVQLSMAADLEPDDALTPSRSARSAAEAKPAFTEADRAVAAQYRLTDSDQRLIVVLQQNLDLVEAPFDAWAAQAGCAVDELLSAAARFAERRQMRRFAAVLRHREAGFQANVMGVWNVPADQADAFGAAAAPQPAVSHCYLRPSYEDWPYSVYTMVHGQTREACLKVLDDISRRTGIADYAGLWSVKEYKKTRVRYFTPDTAKWEAEYAPGQSG